MRANVRANVRGTVRGAERGTERRTIAWLAAAGLAAASMGCTWVSLTDEGEAVRSAPAAESCERLGRTTTKVANRVLFFGRSEDKVADELETLARNEAARMGGNTVVAESEIDDEGRRTFGVYRCGPR